MTRRVCSAAHRFASRFLLALGLALLLVQTSGQAGAPGGGGGDFAPPAVTIARVVATYETGVNPHAVAVNPLTNRVYVANYGSNTVSVFDGGTDALLATIPVGSIPHGVAVNIVTNRIYVANYGGQSISVIDGATNTVLKTIGVPNFPRKLAVNPGTNRLYVTTRDSHSLRIIDTLTNTIVGWGVTGAYPLDVEVNTATGRVYVVNQGGVNQPGDLSVFDGSGTSLGSVAVGVDPLYLSVDSATDRIYVTASTTVSVVDRATQLTVATVPVNGSPSCHKRLEGRSDAQRRDFGGVPTRAVSSWLFGAARCC